MKRIFNPFILALLTLLPTTALAHDFEVDGIYYNINGTEATVTFKGTSSTQYSNEYTGSVNIPATVTYGGTTYSVTTIGNESFYNCSGLTSITIPNSVTTIGNATFDNCSGLTNVAIPNSVTSIGNGAFTGCSGLTSVNIPNSVTTIGSTAFANCTALTNIYIPYTTTSIGDFVFNGCSGLTSIIVESSNNKYDSRNNCNAIIETAINTLIAGCKNTTIPNSVISIGGHAFYGCSDLTSITFPNSVTTIGIFAFDGCSSLTSVNIPSSVTYIGEAAFQSCSGLTSVNISNSVTTISNYVFSGCYGLTSVNIPNSVNTIGDYAFQSCKLTSVTIPNSVTYIGSGAFNNINGLSSVICLAATPPIIGSNSSYAFSSYMTRHATLYVPKESVIAYQTAYNWKDFSTILALDFEVDGVWYHVLNENTVMVIQQPEEEDYYQGDVVIPDAVTYEGYTFTVTAIDAGAFEDCFELSSVVIDDAVESIGENAFQGCTGLTSVTIGGGVTSIGAKAFNYCNALQTVTCRGTVPPVMASSNCFSNAAYSRAVLKVPRPEIETYAATNYRYKFAHIEGWGYLGPGDVNGSGTIDMDDLTRLINIMLTDDLDGIDPSWADVTGNGIVSMNDLTELINLLLTQ